MNLKKLYQYLAAASGLIGLGMLLGHGIGNGTSTTPQWVGGILILLAAVLVGMSISTGKPAKQDKLTDES